MRKEIPFEETWVNCGGSRKISSHMSLSFTKKAVTNWSILGHPRGLGYQRGETYDTKYSIHAREKGCTRKARGKGFNPKATLKGAGSVSRFRLSPQMPGHAGKGVGGRDFNSLQSLEMTQACSILFPAECPHETTVETRPAGTRPPRAAEVAFPAAGNRAPAKSSPGHPWSQQTRAFLTHCRVPGGVPGLDILPSSPNTGT